MSVNGKRVLPSSAATTAALIPLTQITQTAYADASAGRSGSNDDLVEQLVGGLVQTPPSTASDSPHYGHSSDFSGQSRTYSIDDEEIDEPPVPIPSTWREEPKQPETGWWAEQIRASLYGFVIGLFVVIPAVMLLTGHAERLPSWATVATYVQSTAAQYGLELPLNGQTRTAQTAEPSAVLATVAQSQPTAADQSGSIKRSDAATKNQAVAVAALTPSISSQPEPSSLTTAPPLAREPSEPQTLAKAQPEPGSESPSANTSADPAASAVADADPGAPPPPMPAAVESIQPDLRTSSGNLPATERAGTTVTAALSENTTETAVSRPRISTPVPTFGAPPSIDQAQAHIKGGNMENGRIILAQLASRGDKNAIFALAESFDPNVLAAWGTRGAQAEPDKARMFYSMALSQGVKKAAARIKALE